MRASSLVLVVVVASLAACGGSARKETSTPDAREPVCSVAVLPPATAAPPPEDAAPSRVVAHVTLPLAQIARELEARIPKRLAEERDRDIGVAGRLQITVDRGALAVTAQGESLVVRAPLRARAEACAKGRCYASCEPEAVATVTVPLRLTPGFAFAPSHAEIAMTRSCQVKALGGLLRVDVTPMVEKAARAELRRVEQEVDARLPKLRPQAERIWKELDRPMTLPAGCVEAHPEGLVQGPSTAASDAVRLRFALAARPEIRARCAPPSAPPRPLPPLAFDAALPAEAEVAVALVSALSTTTLVRGVACGDGAKATVTPPLAWTEDGKGVRATGFTLSEGAPTELASRLVREVVLLPLLPPEGLREAIPALAGALGDPTVDVRAQVAAVRPTSAFPRGEDLVASVRLRGAVEIRPR